MGLPGSSDAVLASCAPSIAMSMMRGSASVMPSMSASTVPYTPSVLPRPTPRELTLSTIAKNSVNATTRTSSTATIFAALFLFTRRLISSSLSAGSSVTLMTPLLLICDARTRAYHNIIYSRARNFNAYLLSPFLPPPALSRPRPHTPPRRRPAGHAAPRRRRTRRCSHAIAQNRQLSERGAMAYRKQASIL